ncbi:hypothetical protein [Pseudomonas siliginis]|uniref:hypothetical protein n=1 Tax=Pseudomonas siliginis TaxID=2842346 RepID=UPI002093B9DB|nr:hypothetical protein [Pseudomonas siliginis]UST79631.1 hypothetical protein NF676_26415 [Pseudomonas siliginis]
MKTFVILTRRADGAPEDFKRLAKREVQHVWQGFADGIVRAVHGLADGPGAAFELESMTFEEARQYIEALPYVRENLLLVQYCALKPFSDYERLVSS